MPSGRTGTPLSWSRRQPSNVRRTRLHNVSSYSDLALTVCYGKFPIKLSLFRSLRVHVRSLYLKKQPEKTTPPPNLCAPSLLSSPANLVHRMATHIYSRSKLTLPPPALAHPFQSLVPSLDPHKHSSSSSSSSLLTHSLPWKWSLRAWSGLI